MRNKFSILPYFLLAELILSCGQNDTPATQKEQDKSGWHTTVEGALKSSEPGPRLIIVTRSGWGPYEKNTYDNATIAPVIAPLARARVDASDDTQRFSNLGIDRAPALVLLTPEGGLITKIIGPRDMSLLKRSIQRAIEFPVTRTELAKREDTAAHLRWIEVSIEDGDYESAAIAAKRYLSADKSADAAHGQFLFAYATAELGGVKDAQKWADEYLKRYPKGEDAGAAKWIGIVLNLQNEKPKPAEKLIMDLIKSDSGSPFTRQAVIAFSMEHLARQTKNLEAAAAFLTSAMKDSAPWSEDFLMARATLGLNGGPEMLIQGINDLKTVANGKGMMATEAQDRLVMIASAPQSQSILPEIILHFQDIVMKPDADGATRIRLARLYIAKEDIERAKNELKVLAASGGEYADDALLFHATLTMEGDRDPAASIPLYEEAMKKYPSPSSTWAARYGLARAYFFSGQLSKADAEMAEVIKYLASHRYLPEAFLLVQPQPLPPQKLAEQLGEYRRKISEIKKEEKGEAIFKELIKGVLASSKGDTIIAESAFKTVTDKHPESTLADDAYLELAKMHLRSGDLEATQADLNRIVTSYKGSDQFEPAQQMLAYVGQYAQLMQQMNGPENTSAAPASNQDAFINSIEQLKSAYLAAPNELKKSALRAQRGKLIKQALNNSRTFTAWFGTIQQMETTRSGKAILSILLSGSSIKIETWNNAVTDVGDNTLIPQGTELFTVLSEMKKGDRVKFGGTFLRSSGMDFIKERSITESGSMADPVFICKFASVENL